MATSEVPVMIRAAYREFLHITKQSKSPNAVQNKANEIRSKFRRPLAESETTEARLQQAQSQLSFLRMSSVKLKPRGEAGMWVYRNGERLENVAGALTLRDATGRVVSSYDGKNLDPQSVTRHRKLLKRAGFANNAHAKGLF